MTELVGLLVGFILTLFIYSYVVRDNPLYRLAVHILVGVSAAYAAVVVIQEVLSPVFIQLRAEPAAPASALWLIPLFLALLLLLKLIRPVAWLGNSAVAVLIGVGAAVALAGAMMGTLFPQVAAIPDDAFLGLLAALLTVCTLLYFHFSGRATADGRVIRPSWQRYPALVGQAVLMITFGALFASVLNTSLVLLSERISFFINQFVLFLRAFV